MALADEHIKASFTHLNIDVTKAPLFFALLDHDKSGSVTVDEFIYGCMRLQGFAKPVDVANLIQECRRMGLKIDDMGNFVSAVAQKVGVDMEVVASQPSILG